MTTVPEKGVEERKASVRSEEQGHEGEMVLGRET